MNKKIPYKYINLLVRLSIGVVAIIFIYVKMKERFIDDFFHFSYHNVNLLLLLLAFLLFIVNWGVEAYKWRWLLSQIRKISWFQSFKIIMTSITISLLTPNRVGEVPARVLLLNNRNSLKREITYTFLGAYAQGIATLLFGVIGLYITLNHFINVPFIRLALIITIIFLLLIIFLFFNPAAFRYLTNKVPFIKRKDVFGFMDEFSFSMMLSVLGISMIRYFVFFVQYYLILTAFHIEFNMLSDIFLIAVCFFVTSTIPTILISEIGVRGSTALFIFGFISDDTMAIVLSSIVLWGINVAFPAIIGLAGLNKVKVYHKK